MQILRDQLHQFSIRMSQEMQGTQAYIKVEVENATEPMVKEEEREFSASNPLLDISPLSNSFSNLLLDYGNSAGSGASDGETSSAMREVAQNLFRVSHEISLLVGLACSGSTIASSQLRRAWSRQFREFCWAQVKRLRI